MPHRRLTRPLVLLGIGLLLLGAVSTVALTSSTSAPAVGERPLTIPVKDGPARDQPVSIDATLFTPARTPAPAVLLAHGFGGSKDSVSAQARSLAQDGFVVLTYSARGFGKTTGQIAINSPDYEVADARALVDFLATQPEVTQDGPGDPHVGVAGGSYGGALALSLGGSDRRIDAIAAAITWNDLGQALFPDLAASQPSLADTPAAGITGPDGVLKRSWAGIFFGAGAGGAAGGAAGGPCGKFTAEVCADYVSAAQTGRPSAQLLELLRRNSPASTNASVRAPTLLLQGQQDTLFGLDQADTNSREIAAAGAPTLTSWFAGGHDAGGTNADADAQTQRFLDFHLAGRGANPGTGFSYQLTGSLRSGGKVTNQTVTSPNYPGLRDPTPTRGLALSGAAQPITRPAGGSPSSVSTLPGLGSAFAGLAASGVPTSALTGAAAFDIPGQAAVFRTAALPESVTITGSSRVDVTVAARGAPTEAVLFAKLYDVAPDGSRTLPGGGVSAFRIPALPTMGGGATVTVTLPGTVAAVAAGHHLEFAVSTTDQAYATPLSPAGYTVGLAPGSALTVPVVEGTRVTTSSVPLLPLVGVGVILLGLLIAAVVGRARGRRSRDAAGSDIPLVVSNLAKSYADGYRAVDGVDFTVRHGQVLGLLGPNGAGKTTVLRMLMGLISPSGGQIRVFGHVVAAGSPVLSRLGSFVEGAGFLPHRSGGDNLAMYWAATGRPAADAHLHEALRIAGLGSAIDRKVRSYSQGMRQRLAIAQAMLGLPELLVLDEPTNGLDPPQIMAMRAVLRDYAATGRAVLVSSHLLSEVEQTCSHVVVMHKGKVVAAGTVAEIVSADGRVVVRVDEPEQAVRVLQTLEGIGSLTVTERDSPAGAAQIQVDLEEVPAAEAVRSLVTSGVAVSAIAPRNRLEDVFLALVENSEGDEADE